MALVQLHNQRFPSLSGVRLSRLHYDLDIFILGGRFLRYFLASHLLVEETVVALVLLQVIGLHLGERAPRLATQDSLDKFLWRGRLKSQSDTARSRRAGENLITGQWCVCQRWALRH